MWRLVHATLDIEWILDERLDSAPCPLLDILPLNRLFQCGVSQRKGTSEGKQTPEQKGPPRSFFAKPWKYVAMEICSA